MFYSIKKYLNRRKGYNLLKRVEKNKDGNKRTNFKGH